MMDIVLSLCVVISALISMYAKAQPSSSPKHDPSTLNLRVFSLQDSLLLLRVYGIRVPTTLTCFSGSRG